MTKAACQQLDQRYEEGDGYDQAHDPDELRRDRNQADDVTDDAEDNEQDQERDQKAKHG